MKNKRLFLFLMILVIVLFACEGLPSPDNTSSPPENDVATAVSAT